MAIDKSPKLIFNEFQRSISEVPLEVYYQRINADQYNSNGFQFNIKQPGSRALLDTDIWVKYTLSIRETADFAIRNMYLTNNVGPIILNSQKFGLRSGNVMWRCMQNFSLQINNQTLSVQPYKYVDILNRLYISNEQAEHEFSASGGGFEDGNHSDRTDHIIYQVPQDAPTVQPMGPLIADKGPGGLTLNAGLGNSRLWVRVYDGFNASLGAVAGTDLDINVVPPYPKRYEFYNPGFSKRFDQMTLRLRERSGAPNINWNTGILMIPDAAYGGIIGGTNQAFWNFEIYERLPITLFKMYSNDGVFGVIPNIIQMQIQGNFLTNFAESLLRSTNSIADDTPADVGFYWQSPAIQQGGSCCEIYLKWYTPPMNMPVPRELSVPYPKIVTWSQTQQLIAPAGNTFQSADISVQNYNITLESIPDLLLIYVRGLSTEWQQYYPDDYLMEIKEIMLNIDNASGKLNQITSFDLYQKWKKILKHSDSKIIGFDEWKKYCCVAALQPEDYGVRYGPGYSNQTVLGIRATCVNHHNVPTIGCRGTNRRITNINGELIVTCIYNRNRMIIRDDGTAQMEMVKMAADFNVIQSQSQLNTVMEDRGRLNL